MDSLGSNIRPPCHARCPPTQPTFQTAFCLPHRFTQAPESACVLRGTLCLKRQRPSEIPCSVFSDGLLWCAAGSVFQTA
ncbi:hypothetical protein ACLD9W_07530 [Neisseria sp. WLZKY-1]|uniref:hypothetical protein n=1 Tax=Neisseria sp. WLZKY-1 TaxID=3390377 RepID=UPI00397CFE84